MATIKAIEAQSVHQIQSGQVIVDLCSVVKELVENGLDAGASSIEVRFKNNGLDSIEVQDNGSGISPANYESVALKHHTSKLSGYEDLSSLQTFGFRGEALSSLCALSTFYMITAQADEAPKGKRLDFETSGKLKSTSVVACQKGTTATVEGLFESLPVRRKELAKNIKREYGKVIGLLHAYACVCTSVRFAVKNAMPKGNSMTVFATKSNATTRENIANVYGAKTLQALVALDLDFDFQPTLTQLSRSDANMTQIKVNGHISRPVWGEGRQTPDRQMFFVNGRPCGLPQVAKAMNEVYKSFSVSQSPFIFADFEMDTNAYDVNVSPDKRTILLHNATDLIEKLKESLNALFETQDQTVPQANVVANKLPAFKQLSIQRSESTLSDASERVRSKQKATSDDSNHDDLSIDDDESSEETTSRKMLHDHIRDQASTREEASTRRRPDDSKIQKDKEKRAEQVAKAIAAQEKAADGIDEYDDIRDTHGAISKTIEDSDDSGYDDLPTKAAENIKVRDFNRRIAEQQKSNIIAERPTSNESSPTGIPDRHEPSVSQAESEDHPNLVQNAFDRMRPHRPKAEVATITIGDHTTTAIVGSGISDQKGVRSRARNIEQPRNSKLKSASTLHFSQSLRRFGAPGTQVEEEDFASEHQSAPEDGNAKDEGPEGESHESLRESVSRSPSGSEAGADDSDPDYIDQAKDKAEEERRVAELIRLAEESAAKPTKESLRRANKALKGSNHKDSTANLLAQLALPLDEVENNVILLQDTISGTGSKIKTEGTIDTIEISEEEKLSLTISKSDFAAMEIIGQFNLGFILAVRKASVIPQEFPTQSTKPLRDELFIIDQHASDEKYNFERLQATTTVSNQRLVRPIILELTAVEEEIVLENLLAIEKNGFIVSTDTTGESPVGQRCKLLTLPLSKEVTFDTRDLDELIHLLSESPITLNSESAVPRPGKVRKMFAMRACRSSIMIGKTLSVRQMGDVLRHMGEIEKPWNCPHGRPTMRHLTSLDTFGGWTEGAGLANEGADGVWSADNEMEVWRRYGASYMSVSM